MASAFFNLVARGVGVLLLLVVFASGCAGSKSKVEPVKAPDPFDEQELHSALGTLSDDLMYSTADVCAQVIRRTDRPDAQMACASMRLGTGLAAISAATTPNCKVGYADLLTLVTLQRMSLEEPAASVTYAEADRRQLHDVMSAVEQRLWSVADRVITSHEQEELHDLIVAWRKANPTRAGLTQVRLQEFAPERGLSREAAVEKGSSISVLRLLRLDPMQGLDPATRQLRESRLLAERLSFWAQRFPVVLGWQMELTTARVLSTGPTKELTQDAAEITKATTQFSQSTDRLASSYQKTIEEFPKERQAAIEQVDRVLDARIKTLLDQLAASVASERKAATDQVGEETSRRLREVIDRLNRDVDAQSKQTIDRAGQAVAAERARTLADAELVSQRLVDRMAIRLVLVIGAGAVVIAVVALMYRRILARSVGDLPGSVVRDT